MNIQNYFNFTNGFQSNDENLETFLKSAPACVYCKDTKGKYLEVNDLFLFTNDGMSASDVLGKRDIDLHWRKEAPLMMQNDKKIISMETSGTFVENALSFGNKIRYFLSHKLPFRNRSGKIIGTIGTSFLLDDAHVVTSWLKGAGFSINVDASNLINAQNTYELSPRQTDCLVCLVKGMTIKQISKELDLSPKTVEHYLEAIKQKLRCHSRHELVTKALQMPIIRNQLG